MTNNFEGKEEALYPAEFHLRIVTEEGNLDRDALEKLVPGIQDGNRSTGGKYHSLQVAVRFENRDEHHRLQESLMKVRGVKMVI